MGPQIQMETPETTKSPLDTPQNLHDSKDSSDHASITDGTQRDVPPSGSTIPQPPIPPEDLGPQNRMVINEMNKLLRENLDKTNITMQENQEKINASLERNVVTINSSIKEQLGTVKSQLTSLDSRIKSLESTVETRLSGFDERINEQADQMNSITKKQDKLAHQYQEMDEKITSLMKLHKENKKEIDNLKKAKSVSDADHQKAIAFRDNEISDALNLITKLQESLEEQDSLRSNLQQSFEHSKKCNSKLLTALEDKIDQVDTKTRKNNIIIDGVPETNNEVTETTVLGIINKADCNIQPADINAVYRFGTAKGKKPRSIMITLNTAKTKDLILKNIKEIKKKNGNKHLWFNKDQADSIRRKFSLLKRCHALCRQNKHNATLKGDTIHLNGKIYKYNDLSLLPEKCRPEDTKTTTSEDGLSIGYHSELVYLSNFYPCCLHYEGNAYVSAEQAFQHVKAKDAGYPRLASDIMETDNPYTIKHLGEKATPSDAWRASEISTMKSIIKEKFLQNPHLMKKLVDSPFTKFYEMTTNLKWATGNPRVNKPLVSTELTGENHQGIIIAQLKDEFKTV